MIQPKDLDGYLQGVTETLDIPDSMYAVAAERYEALGRWMQSAEFVLGRRPAEVYTQGSTRLGTAIRPLTDSDTLDVDLVHERDRAKPSITQKQLKSETGELLRRFVAQVTEANRPTLTEKRRCWTLTYDESFHMDVLPAIPDADRGGSAINITDRDLLRWQDSDPKAYSNWFWQRMQLEVDEERKRLLHSRKVEQIPDWQIKTTLQRVVQLLKRHRDVQFRDAPDDKPASIILTTLAARAYQRQSGLAAALQFVLRDMHRGVMKNNGVWWIVNPAHDAENFADRWRVHPSRAAAFFAWLERARADFGLMAKADSTSALADTLRPFIGEGIINEAWSRIEVPSGATVAPVLITSGTVPGLADASHARVPPWPTVKNGTKVSIDGEAYLGVRQGKKIWKINPDRELRKSLGLRFIANTNARMPYEVYWQVVNTGPEAKARGQLRGDFERGEGDNGAFRWESTEYRGTHWIEAFIVKDGRSIARSGRFHVRIR